MHSGIWSWMFIISCPFACEGQSQGPEGDHNLALRGDQTQLAMAEASLLGQPGPDPAGLSSWAPYEQLVVSCAYYLWVWLAGIWRRGDTPPREARWDFQTSSPLLKFCSSSSTYCKELSFASFSFGQHLLDPWYMAGTNNLADQERHKPCLHTS